MSVGTSASVLLKRARVAQPGLTGMVRPSCGWMEYVARGKWTQRGIESWFFLPERLCRRLVRDDGVLRLPSLISHEVQQLRAHSSDGLQLATCRQSA